MWPLLAIAAAEPPSVDEVLDTGRRSYRDAAVVIGIEDYEQLADVPYAFDDALLVRDFAEETQGISRYRLFYRSNPSEEEMRGVLSRGMARVRSKGTLWIYFAGQGVVDSDGAAHLLAADADPGDLYAGITLDEIEAMANRSRAGRVVVIIDASFDDSQRDELAPRQGVQASWGTGEADKVVVWVADDQGAARSYEPTSHGLFTWLVMGAFQGWADTDGDDAVTLSEAQEWVRRSAADMGRPQRPSANTGKDWVLVEASLRQGPSHDELQRLSVEDRDRRLAAATEAHQRRAEVALEDAVAMARAGGGRAPVEAVIRDFEHLPVSIEWVPPVPAVDEARALLEDPEALVADVDEPETGPEVPEEGDGLVARVEVEPPQPMLSGDDCDDLIAMEPDALMGIFSPGRVTCIEARITKSKSQTDKDKLSRLLLANAEASGDKDEWERLMRRHLTEIDRSDPDMCMLLAIHLQRKGVEFGEEVILWSDAALENKHRWEGETYKARLYALYRMRAEASNELWKDAEQNLIAEPTDENDRQTALWRGRTKDYSREWLDYAAASGQEPGRALALCVSAAGTKAACED